MIRYVRGNLFSYFPRGCIVAHVCNDVGKFGAGFAADLARQYPAVKADYIQQGQWQLGTTVWHTDYDHDLSFASMIAMRGVRSKRNPVPLQYDALDRTLAEVGAFARQRGLPIHAPMFGSGLAGGDWEIIQQMIFEQWHFIDVIIYSL